MYSMANTALLVIKDTDGFLDSRHYLVLNAYAYVSEKVLL